MNAFDASPPPDPQSLGGWVGSFPDTRPINSTSNALEASHVAGSGAGRLYGFSGFNSKASAQFILVFDAGRLADVGSTTPAVLVITVGAAANFSAYFGSVGRWFSRGIVLANSSTEPTLTAGSADCFFDVQYS